MLSKKFLMKLEPNRSRMLFLAAGRRDSLHALAAGWLTSEELPHVSALPQGIQGERFTPEVALFPGSGFPRNLLRRACGGTDTGQRDGAAGGSCPGHGDARPLACVSLNAKSRGASREQHLGPA